MRLLKQLKSSYNKRSGLPKGFTEVEYLASNSNAYIRTNIYPTDEYGYKIINTYTLNSGEQCAIGCMDSGNRFVGIYTAGNANQLSGAWGTFVGFLSIPTTWDNNTTHTVECNYKNNRKIVWNGNELKDISDIQIAGTISKPLVLFGRDSGTITGMNGKIYKVIITKGTEIVNEFIPCLNQENTPCMYDIINKQAYYNVGTGNFTYGKKIYGIEYLESNTTNARISTGVLLDTFPFTVKASVSSSAEYNSFYQVIVGTANSTNQYLIGLKSGDPDFSMKYNNVAKTVGVVPVANKKYNISTTLTATTMVMNINGTDYSYSQSLTANGEEIGLFPQNYNSSSMRIYDTQIIKNDILVADFVPVKDENDIGYMYDKITHRLFANAGTGSFVLGSEAEQWDNTSKIAFVEEYKGKLPRKYTEVEYLESTGTQYINTGLLSTANSKVDCVFGFSSMESGSANNCAIFGGRNNSTTTTFTFFKLATGNPQYFRFDYNSQKIIGTANNLTWNTESIYRFTYDGTCGTTYNLTTGQSIYETVSPASTYTTAPIVLFAVNTNTAINTNMSGRIYKYWYTDGTTTIDLIPVLDETGKPCMYDRVSGNAYYNQGTGDDFIAGPKIRQVEYLESTGTQYIDTGYRPKPTTTYKSTFQLTNITTTAGAWFCIFGSVENDNRTFTELFLPRASGDGDVNQILAGSHNTTYLRKDYAWVNNTKYNFEMTPTDILINSINQGTISVDTSITCSRSIYLFARHEYNDAVRYNVSAKIYSFKILEGDTLVRDFIPVIDENNIGYMFDKVTHTLYTNTGTGLFAYGNLVRQYTLRLFRERDDIPTTYRKVNYLQSTGTQYIDTGIKGKNNIDFDYKCIFTNLDGTAQCVGGNWSGATASTVSLYFGLIRTNGNFAYHYDGTPSPVVVMNTTVQDTPYSIQGHMWVGEQYMVINGTKSSVGTISSEFTSPLNMYLFGINNGEISNPAYMKLYYCKIYDNNILTRDFVPVIRKSDNKPGMYDRITRTFYTNAGSGEFNYGE